MKGIFGLPPFPAKLKQEEKEIVSTRSNIFNKQRIVSMSVVLFLLSIGGMLIQFLVVYTSNDSSMLNSRIISASIVDLILAILLITKGEKILYWILVRAILGAIVWGSISLLLQDWSGLIMQLLLSSYFIYYINATPSVRSFRIANYILFPLFLLTTMIIRGLNI